MSVSNQVPPAEEKANVWALVPFGVFLVFYLGLSILAKDFYKIPMPIAFLVAGASAFLLNRKQPLSQKMNIYVRAMGDENIMIMCLVFILAGIFAAIAKGMGAVDAAVLISRHLIPGRLLLVGIFLVSCFISLAIGTSCGTITALTPIAVSLTQQLALSPALTIGAVVGGAMFGDNLSTISDTTIAATRTQGVAMRDKFLANLWIAVPAAVVCVVIYLFQGQGGTSAEELPAMQAKDFVLVIPYLAVLAGTFLGMNVMALLFLGSVLATVIGICSGTLALFDSFGLMGQGITGMSETLIVALLAGGLLGVIRANGGIKYILSGLEKSIRGPRSCELHIALLEMLVNAFTANNTVAIVITGPVANDLSRKFHCVPRRIASILDTSSCIIQGALPYGAQILIAMGLVKTAGMELGSLDVIRCLFYPQLLCIAMLANIIFVFRNPQKR